MATSQKSRRPIHLVLDWDSTLTTKDTMSLLGNVPTVRDAGSSKPRAEGPAWDTFFSAYLDDYKAHKAMHYPRTQKSSHDDYIQWLQCLDAVELASSRRVSNSGFFKGTRTNHVNEVASQALLSGQMELRSGWKDLFAMFLPERRLLPPNSSLSILSVNFSATFVRSALQCALALSRPSPDPHQDSLMALITTMSIQANEIEGLDLPEGSSGRLCSSIRTAEHKHARMTDLCGEPQAVKAAIVYAGDSATDYECLRAADIGIWICDCAEIDYRERFAQTFKPLSPDAFRPVPIDRWEKEHAPGKTCLWTPGLKNVVELFRTPNRHTST